MKTNETPDRVRPAGLAEGQIRRNSAEFAQFLSVSLGALAELETQLIISGELAFATKDQFQPVIDRVHELRKMLHALRSTLTTNH